MNMDKFFIESPDKTWHAEVSACHGANATKLQHNGVNIFRPLEADNQIDPYLQGSPILLPANRTFKGEFWFEGKKYSLPINEPRNNAHLHGLLHCQQFKMLDKGPDWIKLYYENTVQIYPFPFSITVEYRLTNEVFCQSYCIENTGKSNMPLVFALHTTFVAPESFSVPVDARQENDDHSIPTGRYIPLAGNETLYPTGCKSAGIPIGGYYKACGNTARVGEYQYKASDNFDHWILYNAKGLCELLCVEPQCGAVNGLNTPDGHIILAPHAKEIFCTTISKIK